ncbi:MAG: LptF/LptG family permease [Planctomycetota bacterium]
MILQLYVLRQLLLSFAFALAGIAVLMVPSTAISAVHKVGGVSLAAVLDYLPLILVDLVPYLLPMAFLLGVVAAFGRLAADRELIAAAMAGVHPARSLLPGLLIALVLAAGTNWMLGELAPRWKYEQRDFLRRAQTEAFRTLTTGQTEIDYPGFFLKAESAEGNRKRNVILSMQRAPDGQPSAEAAAEDKLTVEADMADLVFGTESLTLNLSGARVVDEGYALENQDPSFRVRFDQLFPPDPVHRGRAKYFTTAELEGQLRTAELAPAKRRDIVFEIHRRRALSVTYLLFLLLGMPTGILLRSGTQLAAFTGAIGYAFLYYLLAFRLGKWLAGGDVLPPIVAAWATNALFLAAGVLLAHRTLWR